MGRNSFIQGGYVTVPRGCAYQSVSKFVWGTLGTLIIQLVSMAVSPKYLGMSTGSVAVMYILCIRTVVCMY